MFNNAIEIMNILLIFIQTVVPRIPVAASEGLDACDSLKFHHFRRYL